MSFNYYKGAVFMNDVNKLYALWLENTKDDSETQNELLAIKDNPDEILDRFYRNLEFGTAGLRGVLGAGTNRMNIYTVSQATQGLADYLNSLAENSSVAIGYDSRINSDVFSRRCAEVLAANGIKTYIFPRLMPTPMLSYAVKRLGCQGGIVITASHNPSKYNGYKCYDPAGYQMTDNAANETYSFIGKTDMFNSVKTMPFEKALESGLIEYISDEICEEFYSLVLEKSINPDVIRNSGLKIIYTPLNGTGNIPVRTVLERAGFDNVSVVKEQEMPDGTFPTCPYPNPEIKQVFECALAMTETEKADLLLATDPDCDRVGIAVYHGGEYILLSGNDVGVLLAEYMLSTRKANGTLPENSLMTKSFVSTSLINRVAAKYGCTVVDVLTGFKYVGEFVTNLEKENEEHRFIMGFEEAYGYLIGTHARDKDGVAASLMVCEMAAYYKLQGKTLVDTLNDVYAEFGFYENTLQNFVFEGASGMETMSRIMTDCRNNPPTELAGLKVLELHDFEAGTVTDTVSNESREIPLPKSNILAYGMADGNFAIVRPSGTEPKIKVYVTGCGKTKEDAKKNAAALEEAMKKLLKI